MVRQGVAVSVLHRMDTAAVNALLFSAPLRNYAISGNCPVMLIGVSNEDGSCDQPVDGRGDVVAPRGDNPKVDRP